jgi:hypothetical protein
MREQAVGDVLAHVWPSRRRAGALRIRALLVAPAQMAGVCAAAPCGPTDRACVPQHGFLAGEQMIQFNPEEEGESDGPD